MTAARYSTLPIITVEDGVYAPQEDSHLLCAEITTHPGVVGSRVLDLCTGSGIAGIEAARHGAERVAAYDISPRAVHCASANAVANGVEVDVRVGTLAEAAAAGPYDMIVCNPPYVPSPTTPSGQGLHRAWDAGDRGRTVLDQLCAGAFGLLTPGGVVLIVHSELSGVDESLDQLRYSGLNAGVVRRRQISFGPVMTARAPWLEATGRIATGCRTEELVVIEARRPWR